MDKRIPAALVVGLTTTLLAGCGGGSAESAPPTVQPPSASASAAQPSASPAPSTTPSSDSTADRTAVRDASSTFLSTAFGFSSKQRYDDYEKRVKALMTTKAAKSFEEAGLEEATKTFAQRFGDQARTQTSVVGEPKVLDLDGSRATVSVTYRTKVQQRREGTWRTVQTGPKETDELSLVKQGGRWLVDGV